MIPQVDSKAALQTAHRFAGTATVPRAAAVTARGPQFSGLAHNVARTGGNFLSQSSERLIPLFEKITEVFVWSFLAQDAVAMWLPRVGTSLATGRIPYETSEDPSVQKLPFKEQAKIWLMKNIKGLNWVNFNEETKREFATGPGVLTIPALIFMFSRRMFGKSAAELNYHTLKEMTHGFQQHLANSPLANKTGAVTPNEYQAEVRKFFASMFEDPDFKKFKVPGANQTYREYLDSWADDYVKAVFNSPTRKEKNEALRKLGDQLEEVLTGFNRNHRLKPFQYARNGFTDMVERPLHRADYIHVAFDKASKPSHEPIGHLVRNVRRWSDFAETVWKEKRFGGANGQMLEGKIGDIAERIFKKVAAKKMFIAIGTTLLAGAYLVKLAFWAQNHDSYNATRLLKDTPGGGHGAPAIPQSAAPAYAMSQPAPARFGPAAFQAGGLAQPQAFMRFSGAQAGKGGQA